MFHSVIVPVVASKTNDPVHSKPPSWGLKTTLFSCQVVGEITLGGPASPSTGITAKASSITVAPANNFLILIPSPWWCVVRALDTCCLAHSSSFVARESSRQARRRHGDSTPRQAWEASPLAPEFSAKLSRMTISPNEVPLEQGGRRCLHCVYCSEFDENRIQTGSR